MLPLMSIFKFGGGQKNAGDAVNGESPHKDQNMLNIATAARSGNGSASNNVFSQGNVAEARRAKAWLEDRIKQAQRGPISEVVNLTPALAELLLERNPDNRNVRTTKVEEYRRDIVAGNWSLNGETIKLSIEGLLNDGQHRCVAVISAATPIKTSIVFGLPRESRMTVDQGAVRTAGNYLGMDGVADANVAASVASFVWQYEKRGKIARGGAERPTKVQIAESFRAHPTISDSVRAVPNSGRVAGSKSVLAFCHYLIGRRAPNLATDFIRKLCLGEGLKTTDPIYRCRERLLADRRLNASEKIELILRTWNATRGGKVMKRTVHVTGEIPALER